MRTLLPSFLVTVALGLQTGCGLFVTQTDADVRVAFTIQDDENVFQGLVEVDPTTVSDVQEHKDAIAGGRVTDVNFSILDQLPGNQANEGSATVFARVAGGQWPSEPDFHLPTVPVTAGSKYNIALTPAQVARLSSLVFPEDGGVQALELEVRAASDGAPNLRAELEFHLEVDIDGLKAL